MTETRCALPESGLIKVPRPADRETRLKAPPPGLPIRQKEEML